MQTYGNQEKKKSKNTRGIQFYNSDKILGSTIQLGYWQNFANITINPMLPPEKRGGNAMFDYDKQLSVLIPVEKLYDLLQAAKEVMFEVSNGNYHFTSAGINIARHKQNIMIEPLSLIDGYDDAEGIMITLYSDLNDQDNTSNNYISFIFNKSSYIRGYNRKDGSFDASQNIETQFCIFVEYLQASIKALTMADVHVQCLHDIYYRDSIKDSLFQIKGKLGISNESYRNNISNTFQGNSYREAGGMPTSPSFSLYDSNESTIENGGVVMGDRLEI